MPRASNEGIFPNLWSLPDFTRPVSASIFTLAIPTAASSNGLAERPRRSAGLEPRVHNLFLHPRRHYRASRTAPAMVRGHIASSATLRAQHGARKVSSLRTQRAQSLNKEGVGATPLQDSPGHLGAHLLSSAWSPCEARQASNEGIPTILDLAQILASAL